MPVSINGARIPPAFLMMMYFLVRRCPSRKGNTETMSRSSSMFVKTDINGMRHDISAQGGVVRVEVLDFLGRGVVRRSTLHQVPNALCV